MHDEGKEIQMAYHRPIEINRGKHCKWHRSGLPNLTNFESFALPTQLAIEQWQWSPNILSNRRIIHI